MNPTRHHLGNPWCYLDIRPNGRMLCRICQELMTVGDPYVVMWGVNVHRICMKRAVEISLGFMALTEKEIATDPTGHLAEVEMERLQREFAEYRQQLLDRQEAQ